MDKSYSQLNQDIECLKSYDYMKNGYYVDVGANDGVTISNTYLLEKKFGWTGICIEPIPAVFEKLIKERPNSICINKAAFSISGKIVEFDEIIKHNMLSGIAETNKKYDNSHFKKIISVETITLTDILNQSNAPEFIHYLSLDTEGSEFEILKGVDFVKYTFGRIDVEHNFIEPRRTEIRTFLNEKGYNYSGPNKWDDVYIHSSQKMHYTHPNLEGKYTLPNISVKHI